MRKTWSKMVLPVLVFLPLMALVAVGCGEDGGTTPTGPDGKVVDEETSGPVFDEKRIYAALSNNEAVLDIHLGNPGTQTITGTLKVALRHLDGELLSQATRSFSYGASGQRLEVRLSGLPQELKRPEAVKYVVDYDIKWNGGQSKGRRSLFDAIRKLQVILITENQIETLRGGHFALFTLDPSTSKPIGNAAVKVVLRTGEEGAEKEEVLAETTTDENGNASGDLDVPEESVGQGTLVVVVEGNDAVETAELGVEIIRDQKILLTTDKPMYQPGQTIHLRSLALQAADKLPEAGQELIFEVEDAKGNKLAREKRTTDEYGIASAQVKLANELNMGKWTLRAILGDTVSEKTVTVERYTLPKFKTTVQLDKTWYKPGDELTVTGEARYFFGKPVVGGTVELAFSTFDIEFSEFTTVNTTTNEEGIFQAKVKLPSKVVGQAIEQGQGILKVDVKVTDTAGQDQSLSKSAPVAEGGVDVVLVPESGELAVGLENLVYVLTTDPMGTPLSASVTIGFAGEPKVQLQTDAGGLGSFTIIPATKETVVDVKATAGDETVEVQRTLTSSGDTAAVLMRTNKSVYEVGETATVEVRVGEVQERIYLDMVHGGRTVDMRVLEIENGIAGHAFDIENSMEGDVLLSAFYITDQGTMVRDQKLIYVQPANELKVTFTPKKETYLPGEQAQIDVRVADKAGKGVASAVGVQIVDEAVFALVEVQPGLLKVFFDLAKELAEPRVTMRWPDYDADQVIQNPSPEQEKAKVAFAALMDTEVHSLVEDTFKGTVTEMISVLKPFIDSEKTRLTAEFSDLAATGVLTWENVEDYLELQLEGERDFWNKPYIITVDSEAQKVTVRSYGPDEREGTVDDVSFELTYYEVMYGRSHGGFGPGGEWGEMDGDFAAGANDGGPPAPAAEPGTVNQGKSGSNGQTIKVRDYFPETLYVNPAVITEPNGTAKIDVEMADSITEWRVTGLASSANGLLGSGTGGVTVFQDFFVDIDFPVAITRNDAFTVPVAVYNYLETPQAVTLTVEPAEWVDVTGPATQTLTLAAGEVTGVTFDIQAVKVGVHGLTIVAQGTKMSDAVKRTVRVEPDGKAFEVSHSARFASNPDPSQPATDTVKKTISIPQANIDGAQAVTVKVYPGFLSQVVEGMDSMLRLPGG